MSDERDPEETSDGKFLDDLADLLFHIPGGYGVDQYHCDRLRAMAVPLREAEEAAKPNRELQNLAFAVPTEPSLYQKILAAAEQGGFVSDAAKDMIESLAEMIATDPRNEDED